MQANEKGNGGTKDAQQLIRKYRNVCMRPGQRIEQRDDGLGGCSKETCLRRDKDDLPFCQEQRQHSTDVFWREAFKKRK